MANTLTVNGVLMENVTANGVLMERVYVNGALIWQRGIKLTGGFKSTFLVAVPALTIDYWGYVQETIPDASYSDLTLIGTVDPLVVPGETYIIYTFNTSQDNSGGDPKIWFSIEGHHAGNGRVPVIDGVQLGAGVNQTNSGTSQQYTQYNITGTSGAILALVARIKATTTTPDTIPVVFTN